MFGNQASEINVLFELRSSSASSPPPFDVSSTGHTPYSVERPMWISGPEFQPSVHPGT